MVIPTPIRTTKLQNQVILTMYSVFGIIKVSTIVIFFVIGTLTNIITDYTVEEIADELMNGEKS